MSTGRRAAGMPVAVLLTGVAAGLGGAALTLLLHLVQHLAYGYVEGPFALGAEQAPPLRRLLAMTVGGAAVGTAWLALRRWAPALPVRAALADPARRPGVPSSAADAVLQIVAVGVGASLGREGAPRQVAAAVAGWLADRLALSTAQRRTLLACGAGAGLAAVYDVPLGGALFALEILLGSTALVDVVAAVVTSAIATAVAWPVVGRTPTYLVPPFHASWPLVVGALLIGPLAAAVGLAFHRLTAAARRHRPAGWRLPVATTVLFAAVGAVAVAVPLVLGNGRGPAGFAFIGALPTTQLVLLLVLKPVATAVCLRSGAAGGLLTPAVALGAVLGALVGEGWSLVEPGSPSGAFAVVGAAAVLAVTQRAPLTAAVLAVEFTAAALTMVVPIGLAVGGAVGLAEMAVTRGRRQPGPTG